MPDRLKFREKNTNPCPSTDLRTGTMRDVVDTVPYTDPDTATDSHACVYTDDAEFR